MGLYGGSEDLFPILSDKSTIWWCTNREFTYNSVWFESAPLVTSEDGEIGITLCLYVFANRHEIYPQVRLLSYRDWRYLLEIEFPQLDNITGYMGIVNQLLSQEIEKRKK